MKEKIIIVIGAWHDKGLAIVILEGRLKGQDKVLTETWKTG